MSSTIQVHADNERRQRIASVVKALGNTFHGVSEREIAWITGIPKSCINRHLTALRASGVLEPVFGERRASRLA